MFEVFIVRYFGVRSKTTHLAANFSQKKAQTYQNEKHVCTSLDHTKN